MTEANLKQANNSLESMVWTHQIDPQLKCLQLRKRCLDDGYEANLYLLERDVPKVLSAIREAFPTRFQETLESE